MVKHTTYTNTHTYT